MHIFRWIFHRIWFKRNLAYTQPETINSTPSVLYWYSLELHFFYNNCNFWNFSALISPWALTQHNSSILLLTVLGLFFSVFSRLSENVNEKYSRLFSNINQLTIENSTTCECSYHDSRITAAYTLSIMKLRSFIRYASSGECRSYSY